MNPVSCSLLLFLGVLIWTVEAGKILVVFPTIAKSHWSVGSSIVKALGESGHDVTVISPFVMPNSTKAQYRTVFLEGHIDAIMKTLPSNFMESPMTRIPGMSLWIIPQMGVTNVDLAMQHKNVQSFLREDQHFDLVIVESFGLDALYGFGLHYNAPMICVSTFGSFKVLDDAVGNPSPWTYIPNYPSGLSPIRMTLMERFQNFLFYSWEYLVMEFIHYPKQQKLLEKYFPHIRKPLRDVVREDVSMAFINTHFSLNQPKPNVPGMIEIGGINIESSSGKLPKDYQDFLDSATEGAILFSLGSFLQASDLTTEKKNAFVRAFSKLKQKVIWRYNLPDADQLPKNILAREWLPQKEIMAHPNLKLFITHGGNLGTTESVHFGVPMIGIPVFGDQHFNINKYVERGFALKLELDHLSEDAVLQSINTIMGNASYLETAHTMSKVFRDQPMSPRETVVYWSEYVMRHKGAKHMRVSGQDLGFFAYHGLDVMAILLVLFVLLVAVPQYFLVKWIKSKLQRKQISKLKQK